VEDGGQILQQVLFFGLLILGLYLLAVRPQRARAKALARVRAAVEVGSRVITTAGIHATVITIEGDEVVLEIAPDVRVRFARLAVVALLQPTEPTEPTGPTEPTKPTEPTGGDR